MLQTIKLGKKDVDLNKARPLTLRDLRNLKAAGLEVLTMERLETDQLITFVTYVAKKANPEVTDDDILDAPVDSILLVASLFNRPEEPDQDFLESSTSLAGNTDGRKTSAKH